MQYVKITIDVSTMPDYSIDALTYYLSEAGCNSFETSEESEDKTLSAFIDKTLFPNESLTEALAGYEFKTELLPDKDWNEEWERNSFKPVVVDSRCCVCSSAHTDIPDTEYRIFVNPKMAFGSGSHQTTATMLSWVLDEPLVGKRVLDMGCGTAVLGILAAKRGASQVTGIDIDEWSVRNAAENMALNRVDMEIELGDATTIGERKFDTILANINLNILKADIPLYAAALNPDGSIFMSGYYKDDLPSLVERAAEFGLTLAGIKEKDGWCAAKFIKG